MTTTQNTQPSGARAYSMVATVLMAALLCYGALTLLGVVR